MWRAIEKDVYMEKVKGLKPIESFSDPDGTLPFGNGRPAMLTVWGIVGKESDTPIVKCEMQKESRHELEWEYKYFEFYQSNNTEL